MSHRVIQWGTGNVGFHSLRHILRHPDFELVGLHAHSPDKIGKDAGELCGLQRLGVTATNDVDGIRLDDVDNGKAWNNIIYNLTNVSTTAGSDTTVL